MSLFSKTTPVHLDVEGMTCQNCVKHVTGALEGVPGVKSTKVDLASKTAQVKARPGTDVADLVRAVEEAGYKAAPKTA